MRQAKRTSEWDVFGVRLRRAAARALARTVALFTRRPVTAVPTRILFAPETIIEPQLDIAEDIYAGIFTLAGETVDTHGASPFDTRPPSEEWARALHSFAWLVHLEASATELSSSNARALFDDWLQSASATGPLANEPTVIAARVTAWLVEAPLLLNGAPAAFRHSYLRTLGRQLRRLERGIDRLPSGLERLRAVAALALAGVCVADEARLMRTGLALVTAELAAQILPDGGHRSRSPAALLDALAVLVPLREALVRRRVEIPHALADPIDRMLPMLRFFRLGDGRLAPFHGAGATPAEAVDAVLAFDDTQGTAAPNARYTGFQRLEDAGTVVVVDTGTVPPPGFGDTAHASALAFAVSAGGDPIIVNCGPLGTVRPEWVDAARETAAHSTLVLAGASSARIASPSLAPFIGTPLVAGPREVPVTREANAVSAQHDGYRARFGLLHQRRLVLMPGGRTLHGEDRLTGDGRLDRLAFALRFHIAPTVRVRLHPSRRQAILALPNGALWIFTVDEGPPIAVDDSISVTAPGEAQRARQLVIGGNALTDHTIRWHLAQRAAPLPPDSLPSDPASPPPEAET